MMEKTTKTYVVTLPIAGHAVVEVEAANKREAIEAALNSDKLTRDSIESWEAMEQFNQGNVCYCPRPWDAEAELAFGEEDDEEDEDE